MTLESQRDITGLLAARGKGDKEALSRLASLLYPELRRIARRHLGRRPAGHTLESAGLANEADLRLIRADGICCENRIHFLALCSQIMRRILVDYARGRPSWPKTALGSNTEDPVPFDLVTHFHFVAATRL